MNTPGNLVDSPTHRYRESFFEYEYLREFEAKIGTALNVVQGPKLFMQKTRKIRFIAMSL